MVCYDSYALYLKRFLCFVLAFLIQFNGINETAFAHGNNGFPASAISPTTIAAGETMNVNFTYGVFHAGHDATTSWRIFLDGVTLLDNGTNFFDESAGGQNQTFNVNSNVVIPPGTANGAHTILIQSSHSPAGPYQSVTLNFNVVSPSPSYTMTKTADVAGVNADGDVIGYTITLTNTGNVTLTGIVVNDALLGGAVAGSATIAVGASEDYTGSYSTTQADIDNNGGGDGDIDNTATSDSDQLAQQSASETVAIIQSPSYTMTKTADLASVNADGDVIGYTITLTNTGNVTLTGIVVNDALLGGAVAGSASIAVGASEDYTGSYSTTQTDIDNNGGGDGDIDNTATSDSDQLAQQSASETVAIIQTPSYTMTKTADVASVNADGDVIGYTITLTNTGNVTLTGIVVNDALLGGAVAGSASIAVGASEDYTGSLLHHPG